MWRCPSSTQYRWAWSSEERIHPARFTRGGRVDSQYGLFPENEPLRRSLSGLARAVEPGGYLIDTNQPWHPQVELIARSLTNRDGQPWVMRRRTQAEMDQLVETAGFAKTDMLADPAGILPFRWPGGDSKTDVDVLCTDDSLAIARIELRHALR